MDASPEDGSVTVWLEQLKAGDPAAAKPLWDEYFARLVTLARRQLRTAPRASADEEDVALSAFDSFCRGVEGGRFPEMNDRDDLWRVLFVITARKATRLVRHEGREKRGGGRVVPASVVDEASGPGADVVGGAVGSEPSPAFAAEVAEECRRLLSILGEGELRQLAIWKMEGYTNAEIAARWGRSVPTVERKLARIRAIWEREHGA
jgi:DNA-directed RNA polymerase specialized sigma24 family protein